MPRNGAVHIKVPEASIPVVARPDVLVVGGGSAGLSAAIASARLGADVLLLERFNYLGGLATGGLIVLLLTLDDGAGRQVIGGLCQETVDRMEKRGGVHYPPKERWGDPDPALVERWNRWGLVWGSGPHRVRYSVAFDPHELIFAADQMIREAGVRVLYQTLGCEPVVEDGRISAVIIQNKAGRQAIVPAFVIDATGDGDVFAAAGEEFDLERVHPWLWFLMSNVKDIERALDSKRGLFFHAIGEGQVLVPWGGEARIGRRIDATNPVEVSDALAECRQMVMDEATRLKANVPGFEDAYVSLVADQLGVTESRRLRGRYVLRREDLDKPFDDVIAVTGHWTKYACVYNIPYRSLLPQRITNLVAAGRCISTDHRTHHATKEIPPCMATGQAAGTAAVLALRSNATAGEVDVVSLQAELRSQGAILA